MERPTFENEKLQQALGAFQAFKETLGKEGIGRLAEKSLHGVLKFYIHPDSAFHEVTLPIGKVADVFDGERIYEIQTGNYAALQKKLPRILCDYPVTVVCPLVRERYLVTVDTENGEVIKERKSPLKGSMCDALVPLFYLDAFLDHPNFVVCFLLFDVTDYRTTEYYRHGKKRTKKLDRVPRQIVCTWKATKREDYLKLIPADLPETFTAAQFYKASGLRGRNGAVALKLLRECSLVHQIGKQGNANLYTINENCIL